MIRKRMNKKAQFYLIAAVIIAAILIGFVAFTNYSKKSSSEKIYDLGKELDIESDNVVDYGIVKKDNKIEDFAEKYKDYVGEDKQIFFIFGNASLVYLLTFEQIVTGQISIDVGNGPSNIIIQDEAEKKFHFTPKVDEQGNYKVRVIIGEGNYEFTLQPGENFFFVMSQEIGGEEHVTTG